MIFLALSAFAAGMWLWFFAPDVISERVKASLVAASLVTAVACAWFSVRSVRAYADAGQKVVRTQESVAARRWQQMQRFADPDANEVDQQTRTPMASAAGRNQ